MNAIETLTPSEAAAMNGKSIVSRSYEDTAFTPADTASFWRVEYVTKLQRLEADPGAWEKRVRHQCNAHLDNQGIKQPQVKMELLNALKIGSYTPSQANHALLFEALDDIITERKGEARTAAAPKTTEPGESYVTRIAVREDRYLLVREFESVLEIDDPADGRRLTALIPVLADSPIGGIIEHPHLFITTYPNDKALIEDMRIDVPTPEEQALIRQHHERYGVEFGAVDPASERMALSLSTRNWMGYEDGRKILNFKVLDSHIEELNKMVTKFANDTIGEGVKHLTDLWTTECKKRQMNPSGGMGKPSISDRKVLNASPTDFMKNYDIPEGEKRIRDFFVGYNAEQSAKASGDHIDTFDQPSDDPTLAKLKTEGAALDEPTPVWTDEQCKNYYVAIGKSAKLAGFEATPEELRVYSRELFGVTSMKYSTEPNIGKAIVRFNEAMQIELNKRAAIPPTDRPSLETPPKQPALAPITPDAATVPSESERPPVRGDSAVKNARRNVNSSTGEIKMSKTIEEKRTEIRRRYNIKRNGNDYLQVQGRILLLRLDHPEWAIETKLLQVTDSAAIFIATIRNQENAVIATGHGRATEVGTKNLGGRYIEKAETAAIGRALALAGFGTDDTLDDADYLADSPIAS